MKKLNKITLQQKGQVLKPGEMKSIVGGYGTIPYGKPNYGYGDEPYFRCHWSSTEVPLTQALVFAGDCYDAEHRLRDEMNRQLGLKNDVFVDCKCGFAKYY